MGNGRLWEGMGKHGKSDVGNQSRLSLGHLPFLAFPSTALQARGCDVPHSSEALWSVSGLPELWNDWSRPVVME